MAGVKTRPNKSSVERFLRGVKDEKRRTDAHSLVALMREVTRAAPKMWGESIVGFGRYRYRYDSGREGEWFLTGFSPRKQSLTIYIMPGFERYGALLKKLGKHRTGKSCLYLGSLSEIDLPTLRKLIKQSARDMAKSSR
jgi:hypothetical protein